MASVWAELKRRNVVRVAIAYAIVVWLVIEISATTFPILRLPEWTTTFVTVLLIIGFPLALVFAWAYELTPEGLKKEKDVDRSESITQLTGRKLDFAIIAVLTVAVVYLISEKLFWTDDVVSETPMEASRNVSTVASKSIAVLPFVNMSADLDQEYFSDGITEEILNALAAIQELAVTSRTSAFAFKGKSVPIPEIAQQLGITHVLEGSVRKSGTRLRITAQLIDVASDTHLWSETYDRELTDIFALQDEISGHIATALKVNLLGDGAAETAKREVIPEAYDLYLHGLQQIAINTFASLAQAEKYFEQAIAIDPSFVRAYAGIGWALHEQVFSGSVPEEENEPKLREVLRRGVELDSENAGLIGLSGVLALSNGNLEKARSEFSRALSLDPPYFLIRGVYADTLHQLGRTAEAQQVTVDWLEADPLNPLANIRMAFLQSFSGNFDASFATTARLKIIAPDGPYGYFIDAVTRIALLGNLATGIRDVESGLQIDPNDHEAICVLATALYDIGEFDLANAWLEKARHLAPDTTFVKATDAYGHLLRGDIASARQISLDALSNNPQLQRWWGGFMALRYAVDELIDKGDAARAVDLILQAEPGWNRLRGQSFAEAQQELANPTWLSGGIFTAEGFSDLARALRAAGDDKGANNVLSHMEAILNFQREAGILVSQTLDAELHALHGRDDDALDALEQSEMDGTIYSLWHHYLVDNRIFDDIRDHPRYVALLERVKVEMQRQRTELGKNRPKSNQIPL